MNRKVILGVLAWTPITLVVALAIYLTVAVTTKLEPQDLSGGSWGQLDPTLRHGIVALFGGAAVIALLQLVFSIVFIVDASKNAGLQGVAMALWAIGFVFVGELLFPVYWLMHVARDQPPA